MRFLNGLFTFRRIYDQREVTILDHINDMRSALSDFVHAPTAHSGLLQIFRCTVRADDLEATLNQDIGQFDRAILVALAHA